MLGILGSLIATLLFESRKYWRYVYREFIMGSLLLINLTRQKLTLRHLRLTTTAFILIMTAFVFLSQAPKLALDDNVAQDIPATKSQPILKNSVEMRPCVPEDFSVCAPRPIKSKDDVDIAIHDEPTSHVDVQFVLTAWSAR